MGVSESAVGVCAASGVVWVEVGEGRLSKCGLGYWRKDLAS